MTKRGRLPDLSGSRRPVRRSPAYRGTRRGLSRSNCSSAFMEAARPSVTGSRRRAVALLAPRLGNAGNCHRAQAAARRRRRPKRLVCRCCRNPAQIGQLRIELRPGPLGGVIVSAAASQILACADESLVRVGVPARRSHEGRAHAQASSACCSPLIPGAARCLRHACWEGLGVGVGRGEIRREDELSGHRAAVCDPPPRDPPSPTPSPQGGSVRSTRERENRFAGAPRPATDRAQLRD